MKPLKVTGELGRKRNRTIPNAEQTAPTMRNSYRHEAREPLMFPIPYPGVSQLAQVSEG